MFAGECALLLPTGLERTKVGRDCWGHSLSRRGKPLVPEVEASAGVWQIAHSQKHTALLSGRLSWSFADELGTQHCLQQGHLPFISLDAGLHVFGYLQPTLIN